MTWPGFWLSGGVVREPVADWNWVSDVEHPERGSTIMLETRTWYGVPYSVTILPTPLGDKLYVGGSARGAKDWEESSPILKCGGQTWSASHACA